VASLGSRRFIGDNDRLRVQFDETEPGTLRLIHYEPLAIVIDVRAMGSFGTH